MFCRVDDSTASVPSVGLSHAAGPCSAAPPQERKNGVRLTYYISGSDIILEGSPNARHEHAETYLRSVFSVIGIDNIEVIAADGVDISPELRAALESAMGSIETLAA